MDYNKKKKKSMNLNKGKGEMFELVFDNLMKEENVKNVNTNKHVNNCPGYDHLSLYGNKLFEQSKCYTSGNIDEISKQYEKTSSEKNNMSTLFLTNPSGTVRSGRTFEKWSRTTKR